MFLLLNQPSNNTLGVPTRQSRVLCQGIISPFVFPKAPGRHFPHPAAPAAPGDARVRAGGTAGLGIPATALPGTAVARPTTPTQEEGRSITLGIEIPPLQLEGFTPQFTEVSMASVICFCKYVYGGFLHSTNPVRTSNNPQSQLIK